MIGPAFELRLPFGLGIEADALHRRVDFPIAAGTEVASRSGSAWEFPILAKYRFGPPLVKPYIEAGAAFRAASGDIGSLSKAGLALGGGIEIGVRHLRVSPELRFTHWSSGSALNVEPLPAIGQKQNQAEFLIGLSF